MRKNLLFIFRFGSRELKITLFAIFIFPYQCCGLLAQCVGSDSIINSKASYTNQNLPNSNFGSCILIETSPNSHKGYIEYDISSLPNVVDSIYFNIYKVSEDIGLSGRTTSLSQVTQSWIEGINCPSPPPGSPLTIDNQPTRSVISIASWPQGAPGQWVKVNVTAAVNVAIANGDTLIDWYIKGIGGCLCTETYASDDHPQFPPYLISFNNGLDDTIYSYKSTYVQQPSTNYGSCPHLGVNNYNRYGYIEFNLSNLTVQQDSIYFYIYRLSQNPATSNRVVELFPITGVWYEGDDCPGNTPISIVYNNEPGISTNADGTWNQSTAGSWIRVDVTSAVKALKSNNINQVSWRMTSSGGTGSEYYASDDHPLYKPYISYYQMPPESDTIFQAICNGDSINIPSNGYVKQSGAFFDTISIGGDCDSVVTFIVSVNPAYIRDDTTQICAGDSVQVQGGTFTDSSGVYIDTLISRFGCDSVIRETIVVDAIPDTLIRDNICLGDLYILPGGDTVSLTGIFTDTLLASKGCDSIVRIQLQVLPIRMDTITVDILCGTYYVLPNGDTVIGPGNYIDTLESQIQCDSIIFTLLNVLDVDSAIIGDTICSGEFYRLPGGDTVFTSGVYIDTLKTFYGCDSIVYTNLEIYSIDIDTVQVSICDGESYTLPSGKQVSNSGFYTDTLSYCDSVVVIQLMKYPIPDVNIIKIGDSCKDSLMLKANIPNSNSLWNILWSDGSSDSSMVNPQSGKIWLSVSDTNGCVGSDTIVVNYGLFPKITKTFPDSIFLGSGPVHISANASIPVIGWEWTISGQLIAAPSFWHDFQQIGQFEIGLSVKTQDSCSLDTIFIVQVIQESYLFIPNAFTPNGDGLNDMFGPIFLKDDFGEYSLEIYNRWGNLIFTGYNEGWNGTQLNQDVEDGIYFFRLTYVDKLGESFIEQGYLTLVR